MSGPSTKPGATVFQRSGPHEEPATEEFALNEEGHRAAERLRQSSRAYDQLYAYIQRLRSDWDKPNLLRRVYKTWPKYAERSLNCLQQWSSGHLDRRVLRMGASSAIIDRAAELTADRDTKRLRALAKEVRSA